MRKLLLTVFVSVLSATPLLADQRGTTAPTPTPPAAQGSGQNTATAPPAQTAPPRAPSIGNAGGQSLPGGTNLKLEVTITDTFSGTPVKKTVTMVMLNGYAGMIRTTNPSRGANLNVDAVASAFQSGAISLRLTFEYTPPFPLDANGRPATVAPTLNESVNVVLMDGQPMILTESADPATDRKVTLEAKATILK